MTLSMIKRLFQPAIKPKKPLGVSFCDVKKAFNIKSNEIIGVSEESCELYTTIKLALPNGRKAIASCLHTEGEDISYAYKRLIDIAKKQEKITDRKRGDSNFMAGIKKGDIALFRTPTFVDRKSWTLTVYVDAIHSNGDITVTHLHGHIRGESNQFTAPARDCYVLVLDGAELQFEYFKALGYKVRVK